MNLLRNIFAFIAGYAVFGVSAFLLFELSGIDPHEDPSVRFMLISIGYGVVFALIGGFLAQLISRSGKLTINYILAVIMAGFAAFSMLMTGGNHYSQIATIFLFAPASILGGIIYLKRIRSQK